MRNPEIVLNNLTSKAKDERYVYDRIYRNLYNADFYLLAYSRLYHKEGNMTVGADGKTIDGFSLKTIDDLINSLKDESYQPNPSNRVYFPKANGKKRPLGVPSFTDKLLQEVIRLILESIYEGKFQDTSHGFRPNRSCHTALTQVQRHFTGTKWFIEGDIKSFFDNIDHHTIVKILERHIKDKKFIRLIWKFLRAGYLEDWKFHNTYSGTPQGGIISPILSNIYLNELDKYIEKYRETFDSGNKRGRNAVYRNLEYKFLTLKKETRAIWDELTKEQKKDKIRELRQLKKKMLNTSYQDQMDTSYKRLKYVRYADDFLISVIGSKEDCENIKRDLTNFLSEELKLELSQEKTLITNSREKARFLGYDITLNRNESSRKDINGNTRRSNYLKCFLYVPQEKWVKKLLDYNALSIDKNGNWKSTHRTYLKDNDDLEIFSVYNAEIRGLYNYYKLATNVSVLNKFYYFMRYSLSKTLANKYKSSVSKIMTKYKVNGKLAVKYQTKKGEKIRYFYDEGFKKQNLLKKDIDIDTFPNTLSYGGRTSLLDRLNADLCEWCGEKGKDFEVHHIRKLKDLKGKKHWERIMISRNRKTLVLCTKCHKDLHNGKLD